MLPLIIAIQEAPKIQTALTSIRIELEAMYEKDQQGRLEIHRATDEALSKGKDRFCPEIVALWEKQNLIDAENVQKLVKIVKQFGWPKLSEVGEKGSEAAFLILQHADLKLQIECLPMFRKMAESREAELSDLALLEDRVLVRQGKKQLYGTQLKSMAGVKEMLIEPIEDEENVDKRRAKMGMGPLAKYLKGFGIEYKGPSATAPNQSPNRTQPQAAGPVTSDR